MEGLDRVVLDEIRSVMGDDFRVLVDTFRRDSERRLDTLTTAIVDGDAPAVRDTAHSFKGSASNLGATALAGYCQHLETLGRHGDLGGADAHLNRIRDEYRRIIAALDDCLTG